LAEFGGESRTRSAGERGSEARPRGSGAPSGNDFVGIWANGYTSYALRTDGALVAWGNNNLGQLNVPPGNDYISAAAGGYHGLALRRDGTAVGWGYNFWGQATPPPGHFVALACGAYSSYGLTPEPTAAFLLLLPAALLRRRS
jgi:alpha-tubulin suppressor-like RCC1 family protein